jgi:hypothetical protein
MVQRKPLVRIAGRNRRLPAGDTLAGAFGMVPDYANTEGTDLFAGFSSPAATAVMDRTGFVRIDAYFNAFDSENAFFMIFANGHQIAGPDGGTADPTYIHYASRLIPVSAGDTISVSVNADGTGTTPNLVVARCFFIPPKFISQQAPVIVNPGVSYSQSEVATGETWIDGKPIYRRAFDGLVIGDLAGAGTGYTWRSDLGPFIPGFTKVITNQLCISIGDVSDIVPLGAPATAMNQILEYARHTLVNQREIYITRLVDIEASNQFIRLYGWCEYVKG